MPASCPRILVADTPGAMAAVRAALDGIGVLIHASNLEDAARIRRAGVDLLICGAHFDGDRVAALVEAAMADGRSLRAPIVCIRDLRDDAPPALIKCIAEPRVRFIDLHGLREALGFHEAYRRFRSVVLDSLTGDAPWNFDGRR